MPVVQIRIVRVLVQERRMAMPVRMGLARRIVGAVLVPVMLVMHMAVVMFEDLVRVLVLVHLGQMQIDAKHHERRGQEQPKGQRIVEQQHGQHRADEGRG